MELDAFTGQKLREEDNETMRFLYFLTDTFIDVFGITRPDATARRKAALFILLLMTLTLALVAGAGVLLHRAMK